MKHFEPWEFDLTRWGGRDWFSQMDPNLLLILDASREEHGQPVHISPVRGALGRPHSGSTDHDPERNSARTVRAADVFVDGVRTPEDVQAFVQVLRNAGASAIGVYPHWRDATGKTRVGFHVGYRPSRQSNPALWGMMRDEPKGPQRVISLDQAVALVGTEPGSV